MDLYLNPIIFFSIHYEHRNYGLMIESVQISTLYILKSNLYTELYLGVDTENIVSLRELNTWV